MIISRQRVSAADPFCEISKFCLAVRADETVPVHTLKCLVLEMGATKFSVGLLSVFMLCLYSSGMLKAWL